MKCIAIAYITSTELITDIERIMGYHNFKVIESNTGFRVFTGYFTGNIGKFADKINYELEAVTFYVGDSLFLVYPVLASDGTPSMTNLIIKGKGNTTLRNKMTTNINK